MRDACVYVIVREHTVPEFLATYCVVETVIVSIYMSYKMSYIIDTNHIHPLGLCNKCPKVRLFWSFIPGRLYN